METIMREFGGAALAAVAVIICVLLVFSSVSSGSFSRSTDRIDKEYSKYSLQKDYVGKPGADEFAAASQGNFTTLKADFRKGVEYKTTDVFPVTGNVTPHISKVQYLKTRDSSAVVGHQIANYGNTDNKTVVLSQTRNKDGALLDETTLCDAVFYKLVKIDRKAVDRTNASYTAPADHYQDDTITFNFRGDYIITVYMPENEESGSKRLMRQYYLHVIN